MAGTILGNLIEKGVKIECPNCHKDIPEEQLIKRLTLREIECLKLFCTGKSNKEVAKLIFVSEKTAEHHRLAIYKKTRIHNIVLLTHWALQHKYIEPIKFNEFGKIIT